MPPYHPAMMLKVLLYGYATRVTSSRKLEERLQRDVGFMFLAGQARPGHKAIGEFRRRHLAAFTSSSTASACASGQAWSGSAGWPSTGPRSRRTPASTRP